MNGAVVALVVNITVASMFAASYVMIALTNRSQRTCLWFGATYLIGAISPLGDFLSAFSGVPNLMEWLSYAGFLLASLALSASLAVFHGHRPSWRLIVALFFGGVISRIWIWGWARDTLGYGLVYQAPLATASLLAVKTVLQVSQRTLFTSALAVVLGEMAVNLLSKPFVAVALGSGATLMDYSKTTYALISQASSGFLVLAAGIILLLIVTQRAVSLSQMESESDALSGLANRRGFDRRAQGVLARADRCGQPVFVAVFDLDHFKQINDVCGHQAGDTVIALFGALLRAKVPASAVLGRLGGDEFAVLIDGIALRHLQMIAEHVRLALQSAVSGRDDPVKAMAATVSGGATQHLYGETLSELMQRADQALYRAKNAGRNRIYIDAVDDFANPSLSNVLPLVRAVS